ncbi:MAG: RDD family protein [Actinomycetaceae bacterium]|nr:RDD family protein [Actinomycetaceae bacterium]
MSRNGDQSTLLRAQGFSGEEIVTGEGVVLELPSTTVASRLASGIIDYSIYLFILGLLMSALLEFQDMMTAAQFEAIGTINLVLALFVIPGLVTYLMRGSSPGKAIMKTRVVRLDGGTITARQAFIRSAVGVVECWFTFGAVAAISSALTPRSTRLGDLVSGTYVVFWPKTTTWERDLNIPATMHEWMDHVQTRPLPTGLHLNIVEYLRSGKRMTPQAQQQRGRELAAAAENYVTPPPPWGTPPQEFLAALIQVRYDSDARRLSQRLARHNRAVTAASRMPFIDER